MMHLSLSIKFNQTDQQSSTNKANLWKGDAIAECHHTAGSIWYRLIQAFFCFWYLYSLMSPHGILHKWEPMQTLIIRMWCHFCHVSSSVCFLTVWKWHAKNIQGASYRTECITCSILQIKTYDAQLWHKPWHGVLLTTLGNMAF